MIVEIHNEYKEQKTDIMGKTIQNYVWPIPKF